MVAENQRAGLLKVRSKMLTGLDRKLKNLPEWQAFRQLDEMLMDGLANGAGSAPREKSHHDSAESPPRRKGGRQKGATTTVGDLGVAAVTEAGRPLTTDAIVAYVGQRRTLHSDPKRARINVGSAMSHEDRLVSIKWRGGAAWWFADREPPKEEN